MNAHAATRFPTKAEATFANASQITLATLRLAGFVGVAGFVAVDGISDDAGSKNVTERSSTATINAVNSKTYSPDSQIHDGADSRECSQAASVCSTISETRSTETTSEPWQMWQDGRTSFLWSQRGQETAETTGRAIDAMFLSPKARNRRGGQSTNA